MDVPRDQFALREFEHLADGGVEVDRAAAKCRRFSSRARSRSITCAARTSSCTMSPQDLLDSATSAWPPSIMRSAASALPRIDGQRLVELVRKGARKLSEHGGTAEVRQLLLLNARLVLGALAGS